MVFDLGPDFFTLRRGRHEVAVPQILLKLKEEPARLNICLCLIRIKLDRLNRAADKVLQHFAGLAALKSEVVEVDFGVRLLQEEHPEVARRRSAEERHTATLRRAWEVVIERHFLPGAILADLYLVNAVTLVLLRDEELLEQVGPLG